MKPAAIPVSNEANRPEPSKERIRKHPVRKRILKDSRQGSKGYIIAFSIPESGE